jgi:transcriptional regulator with XRE-family HTH domain
MPLEQPEASRRSLCRCELCAFGRAIRHMREALGWSLEQGALPIGLLPAELERLERGHDESPSRLDLAVYAYRLALVHGAELLRRGG